MRKTRFIAFILLATAAFAGCRKTETDVRDNFTATYSVTETWTENSKTMSKPAFTMTIGKSAINSDMLLLNNFANYGAGITAEATISGFFLTIPQQTLSNLKGISGTGKLNGSELTFTYKESYNSVSIDITAKAKMK